MTDSMWKYGDIRTNGDDTGPIIGHWTDKARRCSFYTCSGEKGFFTVRRPFPPVAEESK